MSAERTNWTRVEVEAIVADYFDMLDQELRDQPFSKTEHRRRLKGLLNQRSDGSIEYKHQNISAVLIGMGLPYVEGYKPAGNYQALLSEVVSERVRGASGLLSIVGDEVDRSAKVPTVEDILSRLVGVPKRDQARQYRAVREADGVPSAAPNYLLREARNASLGAAGEEFVINFERARLISEDRERLAAEIEHVSRTRGDHEGFDVLSFDSNGRERLIEVKTTAFGSLTPFYVSQNQVRRSQEDKDQYQVYRVFRFRKDPRLFNMAGAIDENVRLEATEYVAKLA